MTARAPVDAGGWAEQRRQALAMVPALAETIGLPAVFLPYQQRVQRLLDSASVLVVEKSRRVGLTWALAASAVLRAAAERSAGGMDVLYISYAREMTREFVDACALWAQVFALAAIEEGEFLFEDAEPAAPDQTRHIQAFRIRFRSGFEIVALSSAPRSLRGKQGLCLIDEAAFVDALSELMKAALAFLMWGGQVVVCSTHNGASNPFNELVQDVLNGKKTYAHLRITFDDALADGLYRRICLVLGRAWSPEAEAAWRAEIVSSYGEGAEEELFCVPADGDGVWLAAALIEARMTAPGEVLRFDWPADILRRPESERRELLEVARERLDTATQALHGSDVHALGFDFARRVDLSVATVLAVSRTLHRTERLTIEMRRWPYSEQADLLVRLLDRLPRWQAALFDATGAGEAVAEAVQRAKGDRVIALKLTQDWYRLHMPALKRDLEDGALDLIRDLDHREDLRLVRLVRGVPMVPDVRSRDARGGTRHGDFAVALALAHAASRTTPFVADYTPARASRPGMRDGEDRPIRPEGRRQLW